jgi:hypothetical protein
MKSLIKKFRKSVAVFAIAISASAMFVGPYQAKAQESPSDGDDGKCVNCGTGEEECQRVVVGNTTHIFYGKRSAC